MFKKSRYVYEIYREKSFTKAARKLGISQPCLSEAVKTIEGKLGAPLFERATVPVVPTDEGMEYIKVAEQIIELQETFSSKMKNINSVSCGTLRVGAPAHILTYILNDALEEFSKQYPKVAVTVTEDDSVTLAQALADDKIDLLIDSFASEPQGTALFPLLTERLLLAVPESSRANMNILAYSTTPTKIYDSKGEQPDLTCVPIELFRNEKFIMPKAHNPICEAAEEALGKMGFEPKVQVTVDQPMASYTLTARGRGCSFVTDGIFRKSRLEDPVLLYNFCGGG